MELDIIVIGGVNRPQDPRLVEVGAIPCQGVVAFSMPDANHGDGKWKFSTNVENTHYLT